MAYLKKPFFIKMGFNKGITKGFRLSETSSGNGPTGPTGPVGPAGSGGSSIGPTGPTGSQGPVITITSLVAPVNNINGVPKSHDSNMIGNAGTPYDISLDTYLPGPANNPSAGGLPSEVDKCCYLRVNADLSALGIPDTTPVYILGYFK